MSQERSAPPKSYVPLVMKIPSDPVPTDTHNYPGKMGGHASGDCAARVSENPITGISAAEAITLTATSRCHPSDQIPPARHAPHFDFFGWQRRACWLWCEQANATGTTALPADAPCFRSGLRLSQTRGAGVALLALPPFLSLSLRASPSSQRPSLRERPLMLTIRGRAVFGGGSLVCSRAVRHAFIGKRLPCCAGLRSESEGMDSTLPYFSAADMAYHLDSGAVWAEALRLARYRAHPSVRGRDWRRRP